MCYNYLKKTGINLNMNFNWKSDKNYIDIIQPLLDLDDVQKLKQFKHHKHSNRLEHVIQVSYKSYKVAKFLGRDYESVARAGILHDLYFIEGHYHDRNHGHSYWHPRIALCNAESITDVNLVEQDIILKHMFGSTAGMPKYMESWIVNLVDDIQALDDFITPIEFQLEFNFYYAKKALD